MASFGGFLEKRKKDKQMARNSMMSEIDGLVTNLHTDINKMMESSKRIKDQQIAQLNSKRGGGEDLKASADLKENELR